MTIRIATFVLALAALALGTVSLPGTSEAAGACVGNVNCNKPPVYKGTRHCYYLPTVSNGSVTGVQKVCSWY
jgi:hypothetical protein